MLLVGLYTSDVSVCKCVRVCAYVCVRMCNTVFVLLVSRIRGLHFSIRLLDKSLHTANQWSSHRSTFIGYHLGVDDFGVVTRSRTTVITSAVGVEPRTSTPFRLNGKNIPAVIISIIWFLPLVWLLIHRFVKQKSMDRHDVIKLNRISHQIAVLSC